MTKILIIEDEAFIVEALRFLCEKEGWRVDAESDGAAALERISAVKPDIVLLDFMLPNMDGLDILKALRRRDATKDLPIMMLTAKGQMRERNLAELAGVTCFMTKPFSNAELVAQLRLMIENTR
ncbi:response regulator [bacterium]|nr:response regulator [bacterium]